MDTTTTLPTLAADPTHKEATAFLTAFAELHGLRLAIGEVGFGRPCVGLEQIGRPSYLDYNPWAPQTRGGHDYDSVWPEDPRLAPGVEAPDAYHKHACFAVLYDGQDPTGATRQLARWIARIVATGPVQVVEYPTNATGLQVMLSGVLGKALRFVDTITPKV